MPVEFKQQHKYGLPQHSS